MSKRKQVLQLDPRDNVLVALVDLKAGEVVTHDGQSYTLATDVDSKHKFPTAALAVGDLVYSSVCWSGRRHNRLPVASCFTRII